jgi:hypothetical protein
MLKRFTKLVPAFLLTLVAGGLLTLCSLATFAVHTADTKSQVQSCSTACSSHGQPAVASSQKENKDEDDKEPSPPTIAWQQSPTDLRVLYITPIFVVLWFVSSKQKILLTTQLRF